MSPAHVLDADGLRARVQTELDAVLAAQAAVLAEVSPDCDALVAGVARLVAGGKRLRPAFCWWGWRGAGGDPTDRAAGDAVVRVATALELFQAAALIHDDVMDASDTRRGMPATHRYFAAIHGERRWDGDADRFGDAGAILTGDLCLAWSDEVFRGADLAPERRRTAELVFDRMRTQLMGGQYLDMLAQAAPLRRIAASAMHGAGGTGGSGSSGGSGGVTAPAPRRDSDDAHTDDADETALRRSEADALLERARRVICFKSAKYSVEHPLLVGAALGGAPKELVEAYSAYGLALGEAFQLRDDVLGVFGDPAQTGKPAGDDLREGKRTVLVAYALGGASAAQADLLHRHLGDPHLDTDGVAALRRLMVETGALARVEDLIDDGARRAREALAQAPVTPEAREALEALVVAATSRAA
ncbi:geranylgeranyl diphosphate synthase, type I [Quadrisphaera granulorum]|uniref:Geranylgeranyl diphosphate synthase type I n=1 Tax=Quadrisphaera granulorum TaxID=317664 RepID=A0A316AA19_9ACTN|nr:polyprenyl synthetase family protein [Quadrisphaera granulorum]PWJ53714.1 geranylgeranyl diphosphate synthase type I [Quadrisphaera granulorum]SZE96758.1 geranylgeranyl diphosphate synthase, type I [Quadrisphaera granulorum]